MNVTRDAMAKLSTEAKIWGMWRPIKALQFFVYKFPGRKHLLGMFAAKLAKMTSSNLHDRVSKKSAGKIGIVKIQGVMAPAPWLFMGISQVH